MTGAVQKGLVPMIHVPSFIKFGLGIQKLLRGGGDKHTNHRQQGDLISLRLFFSN
jgi:hypothetical protein